MCIIERTSYYCPRCGTPLVIKRVSKHKRKARCRLVPCDHGGITWTERCEFVTGIPPGSLSSENLREVAEAKASFQRRLDRAKVMS